MSAEKLFVRYQDLRDYVNWSAEDAARVHQLRPHLSDCFEALIDDFYDEISRHPEAVTVITGGDEQIHDSRDRALPSLWGWGIHSGSRLPDLCGCGVGERPQDH